MYTVMDTKRGEINIFFFSTQTPVTHNFEAMKAKAKALLRMYSSAKHHISHHLTYTASYQSTEHITQHTTFIHITFIACCACLP